MYSIMGYHIEITMTFRQFMPRGVDVEKIYKKDEWHGGEYEK